VDFRAIGPRAGHGVGNLRKPRFWAMWLERLGEQQLAVDVRGDGAGDMVNLLASPDADGRVALLAWNTTIDSSKADGDQRLDRHLALELVGLSAARYRVRHRRLDLDHTNLAATWERVGGGAEWPAEAEWETLRSANELEDLEPPRDVELATVAWGSRSIYPCRRSPCSS